MRLPWWQSCPFACTLVLTCAFLRPSLDWLTLRLQAAEFKSDRKAFNAKAKKWTLEHAEGALTLGGGEGGNSSSGGGGGGSIKSVSSNAAKVGAAAGGAGGSEAAKRTASTAGSSIPAVRCLGCILHPASCVRPRVRAYVR